MSKELNEVLDTNNFPKLGFGLMRLPMIEDEIDLEQTQKMVDAYMDAGLNYFDTAYMYLKGRSEGTAKKVLVDRYPRDSFMLTTKFPVWMANSKEDRDRIFQDQLQRTGAGYFDLYLLHSVEDSNYDKYEALDCFSWGKELKDKGLIRHFGFSFHGTPELLEQILDRHPEVEFVQIQYNYLDLDNPAVQSGRLMEILQERNIPVIIMEPVKGGTLANLPEPMERELKAYRPQDSAASWALRFAASQPGVLTVLSGMSDEAQMLENIDLLTNLEPVSEQENEIIEKVRQMFLDTNQIGCTACEYCVEGCPSRIMIPHIFKALNGLQLYKDRMREESLYQRAVNDRGRAADCIACAQCESVCPQHLPIIELLRQASENFD